ncbi:hypothetical protein D5086_020709 [Populus alba]|uniref:Uncharacterized protein n=1 Tax=Populus alba TaxID=43335 RepID=A0ACC4BLH4_POPAL
MAMKKWGHEGLATIELSREEASKLSSKSSSKALRACKAFDISLCSLGFGILSSMLEAEYPFIWQIGPKHPHEFIVLLDILIHDDSKITWMTVCFVSTFRRLGSGESLSNTGDLFGINQSFLLKLPGDLWKQWKKENFKEWSWGSINRGLRFSPIAMASYSLSKCTLAEYNKPHSATGVVAQIALAWLKEMWKIIHGVMWLPGKNRLPRIIFVCRLLHNIVIHMEDKVLDELPSSHQHDTDYRQQICETASKTGIVMRENFLSTFLENHHLQHSLPRSRDVVTDSFEQKFGSPNEDYTDVVQE